MNLLEFKRRLMTEPGDDSAEMRAARAQGEEFAEAAAQSDQFEAALNAALRVKPPEGLAEQIILAQAMQESASPATSRWRRPGFFAVAAAVTLAVALTSFNLLQQSPSHDLADHLAWHWQHDGATTVQMAGNSPMTDATEVTRVFSALGLEIEPELMASVRLVKFCPTPDGEGAHIVLNSNQGAVTLFYMPRTQVASGQQTIELPDGMQALAVNVERGSLALIAAPGIDKPALAQEIASQMSFPPGVTL